MTGTAFFSLAPAGMAELEQKIAAGQAHGR
jgi:hypothetical protein